jgi:hypothetical protein
LGSARSASGFQRLDRFESVQPGFGFVHDFAKGALTLTHSPESFLAYEVDCGPGTIRDAIAFYHGLLEDCRAHPYAELYGRIVL